MNWRKQCHFSTSVTGSLFSYFLFLTTLLDDTLNFCPSQAVIKEILSFTSDPLITTCYGDK